jgi:hypothetical protein
MTKPTTIDAALVRALADALGEWVRPDYAKVVPWAAPLDAVQAALAGQPAEPGVPVSCEACHAPHGELSQSTAGEWLCPTCGAQPYDGETAPAVATAPTYCECHALVDEPHQDWCKGGERRPLTEHWLNVRAQSRAWARMPKAPPAPTVPASTLAALAVELEGEADKSARLAEVARANPFLQGGWCGRETAERDAARRIRAVLPGAGEAPSLRARLLAELDLRDDSPDDWILSSVKKRKDALTISQSACQRRGERLLALSTLAKTLETEAESAWQKSTRAGSGMGLLDENQWKRHIAERIRKLLSKTAPAPGAGESGR